MGLTITRGAMLFLLTLILALAAVLYLYAARDARAATFDPDLDFKLCNALAADFPSSKPLNDADLLGAPACSDAPKAANTVSSMTATIQVAGGDSNLGSPVISNYTGVVTADAGIPNGQKVGGLRSDVTLSLLNGPCTTALVAEFVLYDAATSGSTIDPLPPGTPNRFSNLVTDANADEIADANSPGITSNLGIYEDLMTPASGIPITPHARYTGMSKVAGDWQMVSVFTFLGGAVDAFATNPDEAPHPFGRANRSPTSGYNSVTILNDPTADQATISPIHDFCTPLTAQTMLLGQTPGGHTRYLTPQVGTLGYSVWTYGLRDTDNDGTTNASDSCPLHADAGQDTDLDGIPDVCDPLPASGGTDHDGDGFQNRQDNCPTISNGGVDQKDSEGDEPWISTAPDGGPKTDQIGDACDPNPLTAYTEGGFTQAYLMVPKCIGATDVDGDGYCSAQDIDDTNAASAAFAMNLGMDVEYPGWAPGKGDSYSGNHELYWGTDPMICNDGPPYPSGPSLWWPADLVASGAINISDVLALKPIFGGLVPPFDPRYDLVPSKSINISDVLALKPIFGKSC